MTALNVSVIIPAVNEEACVALSVESSWIAGADQVIVVDGGSNDATREQAVWAGAELAESAAGRAIQQNVGARLATGDTLLFLHADSQLGPDCIRQIRHLPSQILPSWGAFRQRIDACGLKFRLLEKGNAYRAARRRMPYGDQAIFMQRSFFDDLGAFPDVPIMEDYLLAKRARRVATPILLPGPVQTSARRWLKNGVLKQTIRNWMFVLSGRVRSHTGTAGKTLPLTGLFASRSRRGRRFHAVLLPRSRLARLCAESKK